MKEVDKMGKEIEESKWFTPDELSDEDLSDVLEDEDTLDVGTTLKMPAR